MSCLENLDRELASDLALRVAVEAIEQRLDAAPDALPLATSLEILLRLVARQREIESVLRLAAARIFGHAPEDLDQQADEAQQYLQRVPGMGARLLPPVRDVARSRARGLRRVVQTPDGAS